MLVGSCAGDAGRGWPRIRPDQGHGARFSTRRLELASLLKKISAPSATAQVSGFVRRTVKVIDYNGLGRWSLEGIRDRYAEHARRFHVSVPVDLRPREHSDGTRRWVYPLMEQVITGIEAGDAACIELGVEFIEEDQKFPFGKRLKSKSARALRRAPLNADQIERVRNRVTTMLIAGHVPHEFREYAKLLRRVGVGGDWSLVREKVDQTNAYVMRFYDYLNDSSETGT